MKITIDAFDTITKGLLKSLEGLEVGGRVETIQTTALLITARILRRVLETWGDLLSLKLQWKTISWPWCEKLSIIIMIMIIKEYVSDGYKKCIWWARYRHQRIFIIKVFRTIVFIFIVISTTFRPICPPAFFRCLSNSGTFTELRTTSFIETTGVACSDSVCYNRVQVLSIPVYYSPVVRIEPATVRWLSS